MDTQMDGTKQHGFTIVEVVVSFVLFSLVAVALVSVIEYVQYSQRQSVYVAVASNAAQSKITEYTLKGYDALAVGQNDDFINDSGLDKLPQGSTAKIAVSQPSVAVDSKQLNVTITYPLGSTTKKVIMKAYVANGGAE